MEKGPKEKKPRRLLLDLRLTAQETALDPGRKVTCPANSTVQPHHDWQSHLTHNNTVCYVQFLFRCFVHFAIKEQKVFVNLHVNGASGMS